MILLLKVLRGILRHPFNRMHRIAAVLRFFKWQLNTAINNFPIVYDFTADSKMIVAKGMTGATGNLYCGLFEFPEMGFVLHFIREGDLFIDVGANIGSYTILASGQNRGRSIVMEPIPSTFNYLMDNIRINQMTDRVLAMNVGVGSKSGSLRFTSTDSAINHVATELESNTIDVPVVTLDHVLADENPSLIKIDVEGFETEVCNGAKQILSKTSLKGIIIELNGLGNRYGFSDIEIDAMLNQKGFVPYSYDPFTRSLSQSDSLGSHNTIYVRDYEFVAARLKSAKKVRVGGRTL